METTRFTNKLVLGLSLVIAMASARPVLADDLGIDDIKEDMSKPMAEWTPVQQYMPAFHLRADAWLRNSLGAFVMADILGDKLSQLGRATVLSRCMQYASGDPGMLMWAVCREDVKGIDLKKLEAELDAEHIGPQHKAEILDDIKEDLAKAQKLAAKVDAAAKDDPGVAQLLALPEQAKATWQKYLAKNRDAFARYIGLLDAIRTGKTNHKNFQGCWDATEPAFAKLVKETTFDFDADRDVVPVYMNTLLDGSIDSYVTASSFAACAYSVHESGEVLADAALTGLHAGTIRVGWRTLALAMAKDSSFKPKFADRSLNWTQYGILFPLFNDTFSNGGPKAFLSITTPNHGIVGKVKKDGDMLVVSFKGDKVETCLKWVETRKVTGFAANGDPTYERVCKKRGLVDNQENDTPVFAKFGAGIAPGTGVITVYGYPAAVWKGKKFFSVLGFPNSK